MLKIQNEKQGWQISDASTGWKIQFNCAAQITTDEQRFDSAQSPWKTITATEHSLTAHCDCHGVIQEIQMRLDALTRAVEIDHRIRNTTAKTIWVDSIRTVDGTLIAEKTLIEPAYLHSLNVRNTPSLPPLCPLEKETPSIQLGRVEHPFFEGLVLWQSIDQPCVVTGALTQKIVHRTQQLIWNGDRQVQLKTEQDLCGIDRKAIASGTTLTLDGVFVQFRANGDLNEAYSDYLHALQKANGSRWEKNPLRDELFFCTWNNYLYWEVSEEELVHTAKKIKQHFPSVTWMCVDNGYEVSTVDVHLQRLPSGELDYDHATEIAWYHHLAGVSFGFDGALGEDRRKIPSGILGMAQKFREAGLHPALWVGMAVSEHSPIAKQHPDWFHSQKLGQHLLLDVSIPEVRQQIEHVFRTYFGPGKIEGLKLDFWSHTFEWPILKFRHQEKTAAEWRQWLFEMIRSCLPEKGYLSIACALAAGAPFLAPWVDSYRFGYDMRDGDWPAIKASVGWSLVPLLTHGFGQPIADADSMSLFKRLSENELDCWGNYAYVTGSLVELGGNPIRWNQESVQWLRKYLDHPCAGQRVWIGDAACWKRDALPRVVYRAQQTDSNGSYLVSLHNWSDQPVSLSSADWVGPIRQCVFYTENNTTQNKKLQGAIFELPARSGKLLRATVRMNEPQA